MQDILLSCAKPFLAGAEVRDAFTEGDIAHWRHEHEKAQSEGGYCEEHKIFVFHYSLYLLSHPFSFYLYFILTVSMDNSGNSTVPEIYEYRDS